MNQKKVNKLTMLGMMTALVFVSNYLRVTMPIAIGGRTSFTLANIMCCLSGLLLGPVGGVASGVGSALYDLTNPAYAPECWITLITKGVMGLVAGLAMADREEPRYGRCTVSAVLIIRLLRFWYSCSVPCAARLFPAACTAAVRELSAASSARFSCCAIWKRYEYCCSTCCSTVPLGYAGIESTLTARHSPSHKPPTRCRAPCRPLP